MDRNADQCVSSCSAMREKESIFKLGKVSKEAQSTSAALLRVHEGSQKWIFSRLSSWSVNEKQPTAVASDFVQIAPPFCKCWSIKEDWLRWGTLNTLWFPMEFRDRPVAKHKNLFPQNFEYSA